MLAHLEDPPAGNVLAFNRPRLPVPPPPATYWSEGARHIIICVNDAFPAGTVRTLQAARPEDCFAIIDAALDGEVGSRHLRVPPIWEGLEAELFTRSGNYEVITFHIAPTHAHVLIREADGFSLDATVELWKEKALSGWGARRTPNARIWGPGYFDMVLRDPREIEAAMMAIEAHGARSTAVRKGW